MLFRCVLRGVKSNTQRTSYFRAESSRVFGRSNACAGGFRAARRLLTKKRGQVPHHSGKVLTMGIEWKRTRVRQVLGAGALLIAGSFLRFVFAQGQSSQGQKAQNAVGTEGDALRRVRGWPGQA